MLIRCVTGLNTTTAGELSSKAFRRRLRPRQRKLHCRHGTHGCYDRNVFSRGERDQMEIRALRYFQTVAMCGSYSRGAELLHISQPAVSRMIRNLEDELGTALFRRHGHGVSLTDAGQVLL